MRDDDSAARFEENLKRLLDRYLDTPATVFPADLHRARASSGEARAVLPVAETPALLAESIRYSLLAPGKRIRPRLFLACAKMLGLSEESAMPAAAALEMIHCFSLIHDDLPCMDDDDFRRGRPSNHKKFGEAAALLAGDSLVPLAFDAFRETAAWVAPDRFIRAFGRFLDAIGPRGLIGGQAAEWDLDAQSGLARLQAMHARKTGALFAAAVLIPMDLAGILDDSEEGAKIHRFACELGLAFQAADDLEDPPEKRAAATNILSHLDEHEVRRAASSGLRKAAEELRGIRPDQSAELLRIADEVIRLLGSNGEAEGAPA